MSDPFIGEIRIVSFNFAPRGWAFCNGQLLPIQQNTALFALLGNFMGKVTISASDSRVNGIDHGDHSAIRQVNGGSAEASRLKLIQLSQVRQRD